MRKIPACASAAIVSALSALLTAAPQPDTAASAGRPLLARRLPEILSLEEGRTIERHLSRGDDHRYQVALGAGEYVGIVVEQHGIDVVVHTRGADGSPIADFQDEPTKGGAEQVDIVASCEGTYTVAIETVRGIVGSGAYAIRIVSRRAATGADRALQEAQILRTKAASLFEHGLPEQAQPLLERALALTEGARGGDDEHVALVMAQLAQVYMDLPDFARAESTFQRTLSIMDGTLGAGHVQTAFVRSRLATLYQLKGERPRAEGLLRPALGIIEKDLGPDHLWFVRGLGTLAALLRDAGDYQQALEIVARQLSILERIDYTDTVFYAGILNNQGTVYGMSGDKVRSQEILQRALEIGERLRGPDDPFLSRPLLNLGVLARERQDYAAAEAYYRRALAIEQRLAGPDDPDAALLLNNIGNIYGATGQYARAIEMYEQALRADEKALGPYHHNTLLAVGNIARISAAAGDLKTAIQFERRADAIVERQLALNLAVGSERQKLVFVRSLSERTDRTISLHLRQALDNPDAASLAALVLLQRKGRVQDAMADVFAAVRQRVAAPGDRTLLDQLNETTTRLTKVALSAPTGATPEERQRSLAELEARREELEATLSRHSAEFRAETQPVTIEAVQATMPADAALIEFAVFRPFDPKAERNADAYGPPHYAAYVLRKNVPPTGIDLGDAAAIDASVGAFRDVLRNPARSAGARAHELDERVMRPLRDAVGDATRLLISPDGDLNLVPFEALVDEGGRYLIERYAISYLTSGRDLLRMEIPRGAPGRPVIVADPFFGEPAADAVQQARPAALRASRGSITTGLDLSAVYFAPLAATGAEARAIKGLFPDATLLTGRRATKATLQQVKAPSILHIASHGFFLDDGGRQKAAGDNPLLRSGLAFAGANLPQNGHADGILTALEASGLDLWGTRLVTLSACDTGVGQIRNGEGVYGLRRAFVLAGAESLVMSLWPVSDYISRDAMIAYYTGLRAGLGRGDALRQAKLAMLKRPNRRHPYYWAGFIQSGDWTDLNLAP